MQRELEKFTNQARFVQMIIDGKLVVSKKRKMVLVQELKDKNFKAFPKVADAIKEGELAPIAENDEEEEEDIQVGAASFDYLLGMPIWSLTKERVEKLLKQVGDKELEIDELLKLSKEDLWNRDLDDFIAEWRFQLDDEAKLQKKVANMGRRASTKLKIAGGPAGKKRKNDSDDSDFEATAPKAKKAAPAKPVGGMLSYLAPDPKKKTAAKPKAAPATAKLAQAKPLPVPIDKKSAKKEAADDVWMNLDDSADENVPPPKANISKQVEPEKVDSDKDDFDERDGPTAGRRARATTSKPVKYNVLSDSDDDSEFDVGKMVKGIGNAPADNSRPLFTTSSRPSSSAGFPKKAAPSRVTADFDDFDDTNYDMLAPPTTSKGPAMTARKSVALSDNEDSSDSLDDVVPAPKASRPKTAPKAAPKPKAPAAAKAKAARPKKEASLPPVPKPMALSPAAKAYAAKKAKQEKATAMEFSDDDIVNEFMDVDEDEAPAARRPARRVANAAPKQKWVLSDDEKDEGETADFDSDD